MKKTKLNNKTVLEILAIFSVLFIFTIITFGDEDPPDNNPNYWKVVDNTCQAVMVHNGDTTYTTGHIRHCLLPDVEQCTSHSCQSDFIIE